MKGIQFVIDETGEKTAVIIDLKEHADLWEDFFDASLARERHEEPRETLDSLKKRLADQGKIDPS
jgi:hypothetical protein